MGIERETETEIDEEEAAMAAGFQAVAASHAIAASEEDPQPAAEEVTSPAPGPDQPTAATPAPAPAAAEKAEQDKGDGKAAAAEPTVQDPFASLPPQVRELLAEIPTLRTKLQEATALAGRVPHLMSALDRLKQQGSAAPSPADPPAAAAPATQKLEKVEALRATGLGDIADALDEIASLRQPATAPAAAPAPRQAEPQQRSAPAQPASDPQMDVLDDFRPSWSDELVSADFQLWLTTKPRDFQAKVHTADRAKVVLDALREWDGYRQQTATTRQLDTIRAARMSAAVTPQGDGRRAAVRQASEVDEEEAAMSAGFQAVRRR